MTDKVEELYQCSNCRLHFNQIKKVYNLEGLLYFCNTCYGDIFGSR